MLKSIYYSSFFFCILIVFAFINTTTFAATTVTYCSSYQCDDCYFNPLGKEVCERVTVNAPAGQSFGVLNCIPPTFDTFCDRQKWWYYRNPTCKQVTYPRCNNEDKVDNPMSVFDSNQCAWQHDECNAADRCMGASTAGAGSGSDSQGRVVPGLCDEARGCVSGASQYKACCSSNGQYPTTTCVDGTCPQGQITGVGVISCITPKPTCDDQISCDDCTSITIKSGMENTCSAGNATGTGCTYKTHNGSTDCIAPAPTQLSCDIGCPPSLPNCNDETCVGGSATGNGCSISHTPSSPVNQVTVNLTLPTNCTGTPVWTGNVPNASGTSFSANLTQNTSYNLSATVCGATCNDSFSTGALSCSVSASISGTSGTASVTKSTACANSSTTWRISPGGTINSSGAISSLSGGVTYTVTATLSCGATCSKSFTTISSSWSGRCVGGGSNLYSIEGDSKIATYAKAGNNYIWQGLKPPAQHSVPLNTTFTWYSQDPGGNHPRGTDKCTVGTGPKAAPAPPPVPAEDKYSGMKVSLVYADGSAYDSYGLSNAYSTGGAIPVYVGEYDGAQGCPASVGMSAIGNPYTPAPPFYLDGTAGNNTPTPSVANVPSGYTIYDYSCGVSWSWVKSGYSATTVGFYYDHCYKGNGPNSGLKLGTNFPRFIYPKLPDTFSVTTSVAATTNSQPVSCDGCNRRHLGITNSYCGGSWLSEMTIKVGPPLPLAVGVNGPGTVTSTDSKINCGVVGSGATTCGATYYLQSPNEASTANTLVTLIATAPSGARFIGWTGCDYGDFTVGTTGGTCAMRMNSGHNPRVVMATFGPENPTVNCPTVSPAQTPATNSCPYFQVNGGDVYSGTAIRVRECISTPGITLNDLEQATKTLAQCQYVIYYQGTLKDDGRYHYSPTPSIAVWNGGLQPPHTSTSPGDDCCPIDSRVYTGQGGWFTAVNNCGTFDYNCNGVPEYQYPTSTFDRNLINQCRGGQTGGTVGLLNSVCGQYSDILCASKGVHDSDEDGSWDTCPDSSKDDYYACCYGGVGTSYPNCGYAYPGNNDAYQVHTIPGLVQACH